MQFVQTSIKNLLIGQTSIKTSQKNAHLYWWLGGWSSSKTLAPVAPSNPLDRSTTGRWVDFPLLCFFRVCSLMQCIFTLVAFELYGLSKTPPNASSYPLGRSFAGPVVGFSSSKRVLLGSLSKTIHISIGHIGRSPPSPPQIPLTDRC